MTRWERHTANDIVSIITTVIFNVIIQGRDSYFLFVAINIIATN
jgi:hypothetical protein